MMWNPFRLLGRVIVGVIVVFVSLYASLIHVSLLISAVLAAFLAGTTLFTDTTLFAQGFQAPPPLPMVSDSTVNAPAGASGTPAAGSSAAVPTAPQSACQYILLTNGEVLHGVVQFNGQTYSVTLDSGAMISLPPLNVQRIASSLSELYAIKAQNVLLTDLSGRVALIRWCIDNALYDEASRETQRLAQVSPQHPMIEVFHRNIDAMRSLQANQNATAQTTTQGPYTGTPGTAWDGSAQTASTGLTAAGNIPQVGSAVTVADSSYAVPNAGVPAAAGMSAGSTVPSVAMAGPSVRELEQMAASLPPEAITIFRKQIQPILSKSCMEAGCHGAGSQEEFRLLRVSSKTSRNTLLRNIFAAIQQIDLTSPEASPLLRKPVAPHGNGGVVFAHRDYATYQLLIAWTYLVAENRYVVSREYLLPPTRTAPVFISTPHGPEKISKNDIPKAGTVVVPMVGVSPTLLPQALYPQDYVRRTTPLQPRKQLRLVTSPDTTASSEESSSSEPATTGVPAPCEAPVGRPIGGNASGVTDADTSEDADADSATEDAAKTAPSGAQVQAGEETGSPSSVKENPDSENASKDAQAKKDASKPTEKIYTEEELQQMEQEWDGADIRPTQIYRPGVSTGNIRTAQPQVVTAPGANFSPAAPMSPVDLLMSAPEGVQNHHSADGAYYYDPDSDAAEQAETGSEQNDKGNAGTSQKHRRKSNSNGSIVWQQMLEMQKALEAEGQQQ